MDITREDCEQGDDVTEVDIEHRGWTVWFDVVFDGDEV